MKVEWKTLPTELQHLVVQSLKQPDLLSLACTNRQLYESLEAKLRGYLFVKYLLQGNIDASFTLFPVIDWQFHIPDQTILHVVARYGCVSLMDHLLRYSQHRRYISTCDKLGRTPLIVSAIWNNATMVEYFVKQGADVDSQCLEGKTALHWASSKGDEAMFRILVQAHANISLRSLSNATPLFLATLHDHQSIASNLLARGADCNLDCAGMTCLSWSVRNGNQHLTRSLLHAGADPNKGDQSGWTPLMFAVENSNVELVSILLASGSSTKAQNNYQDTPLTLAKHHNDPRVLTLLATSE